MTITEGSTGGRRLADGSEDSNGSAAGGDYRLLARRDLRARLGQLNRALRRAVDRQQVEASGLDQPEIAHLAITDRHAGLMLGRVDRVAAGTAPVPHRRNGGSDRPPCPEADVGADAGSGPGSGAPLDAADQTGAWASGDVGSPGHSLPYDRLGNRFALSPADLLALTACVAPELDAGYQRLYAYVLDDIARTAACPALLAELLTPAGVDPMTVRAALGPFGPLRHSGLVTVVGDAATDLLQGLRPVPGLVELLLGEPVDLDLLIDRRRSRTGGSDRARGDGLAGAAAMGIDRRHLRRVAEGLARGRVDVVGVWAGDAGSRAQVIEAILGELGRPCNRVELAAGVGASSAVRAALHAAAVGDRLLWLDLPDSAGPAHQLDDGSEAATGAAPLPAFDLSLAEVDAVIAASAVPVIVSGPDGLRPRAVIRWRSYTELEVPRITNAARRVLWRQALPAFDEDAIASLAGRFRLTRCEIDAVVSVAETERRLDAVADADESEDPPADRGLDVEWVATAVATVARVSSRRFTTTVTPERTLDELVLPDAEHERIAEIGRFHRAWPTVVERWGFGSRAGRGVKALFVGEPGTGKTMAAEVIANELGVDLVKVDLAQVVSKWVGETEKNLEAAFAEAEATDCVLFFDEADSLFGKRGEVRHGTDRYANLEVGYLLQRLEDFDGLVVLASNLQENIDAAFGRRFHFIVHFARPDEVRRRRLWELAFPAEAPVAELDLFTLARLDLTGAGIASTAQTAALLAADGPTDRIEPSHVVQAVVRQFQREGRALRPAELGPYAELA